MCAFVGEYDYKISSRYVKYKKKSLIHVNVILFNLRGTVPHPYKASGKIKFRFSLIDQK